MKQQTLLDAAPTALSVEPEVKRPRHPVWTESKARLIQRYLKLFVQVTHHGTYIDAFAGAQESDKPEMWSAKLVLEFEPRWLRHLHLFERSRRKVARLHRLVKDQPPRNKKKREPEREVAIVQGDCNVEIPAFLQRRTIKDKEATFCLLDQRTFECHWSTVRAVAEYKKQGMKIELFYFLPDKWLVRSMAGLTRNPDKADRWWGSSDWTKLRKMDRWGRAKAFEDRFRDELGYKSVKAWPIHERRLGRGPVMYFMIHATDHPDAPELMARAFNKAVDSTSRMTQLGLPQPAAEIA